MTTSTAQATSAELAIGGHVIYQGSAAAVRGQKFWIDDIGCCGGCEDKAHHGDGIRRLVLFSFDMATELTHVRESSVTAVSR